MTISISASIAGETEFQNMFRKIQFSETVPVPAVGDLVAGEFVGGDTACRVNSITFTYAPDHVDVALYVGKP